MDEVARDQTDDRVLDFDHIILGFEERMPAATIVFREAIALNHLLYPMTEQVTQIPWFFVQRRLLRVRDAPGFD